MLYKQFLEITDKLNEEFVSNFDYWLATLPTNSQENITASLVARKMEVSYSQAEAILSYAEKKGILERYYLAICPNDDCGAYIAVATKDEVASVLLEPQYCEECNQYFQITPEDIYTAYKVILFPDVSEDQIAKAIEERLNPEHSVHINFQRADSLKNDKSMLYKAFYNPSESAYEEFKQLRADLDKDYGNNTTAKGNTLEKLILKIFQQIKFVKGTNEIRTKTNQLDCTILTQIDTVYPSIFNFLSPYFIIECKNEPEKAPGNTYFNKLLGIMETNESKVGIVFARKSASKTYFDIAHDIYLKTTYAPKKEYLLCMGDSDLKYLIDDRINLLEYLDFKIFTITANSRTATWEQFNREN